MTQKHNPDPEDAPELGEDLWKEEQHLFSRKPTPRCPYCTEDLIDHDTYYHCPKCGTINSGDVND
jgi:ribosomal protein S27AE